MLACARLPCCAWKKTHLCKIAAGLSVASERAECGCVLRDCEVEATCCEGGSAGTSLRFAAARQTISALSMFLSFLRCSRAHEGEVLDQVACCVRVLPATTTPQRHSAIPGSISADPTRDGSLWLFDDLVLPDARVGGLDVGGAVAAGDCSPERRLIS